ncbi:MAG: hypothetical protein MJE68_02385 [Proteobacteria bacterium]|nr:hypothetical protein [Pseudomonadota bacterium]
MPNKKSDKFATTTVDDMIAEWMKDPEFVREYEALGPEFDRLERRMRAKKARRAKRKALVKRIRTFWASLMRGLDRIAY